MPSSEARRADTAMLMAVAAMLIFNSHLEQYYPRRWLAADGLAGNTMFIVLSGYGVQCSLMAKRQSFLAYVWRRVMRLYPSVILAAVLLTAPSVLQAARIGPAALFNMLIWPTGHTYVWTILPIYVGIYWLGRWRSTGVLVGAAVLLLIAYCFVGGRDAYALPAGTPLVLGIRPVRMHELYYWTAGFSGAAAAVLSLRPRFDVRRAVLILLLFAGYAGLKYVMVVQARFTNVYPVLMLLNLAVCVLSLSTFGDPRLLDRLGRLLTRVVRLLAVLTLETYLTHELMVSWGLFDRIVFPLNIAALAAATLVASVIVQWLASCVRGDRRLPWRRWLVPA